MFLLSHHHPEEYSRTYAWGPVRVCARCLGTYPVIFAAIAAQFASGAALLWPADPWISTVLVLPALADWAYGRFRPQSGANWLRTGTGVLLGLSLGRTLYVHFQKPFHLWLLAQLGLVTVVAMPVILEALFRGRSRGSGG